MDLFIASSRHRVIAREASTSTSTSRLARAVLHGTALFRARPEQKQAFLFRAVDVAMEHFVLSVTIRRAQLLHERGDSPGARERIRESDTSEYRASRALLDGRYTGLEDDIIGVPETADTLIPATIPELLEVEAERLSA